MTRRVRYRHEGVFNAAVTDTVCIGQHTIGAIPNGTLVEKCNTRVGDPHPDGAPGHVLGSARLQDGSIRYVIEWLDKPSVPTLIAGTYLREA